MGVYGTDFFHFSDSTVFDECDISTEVKEKLIEDIKKKLMPQALKIRSDIEVSCFSYDGVEAVKTALLEGKKCSTEAMPIKINLIAAPLFVVTAQTMDREEGLEAVNFALDKIKVSIEGSGGSFKFVMAVSLKVLCYYCCDTVLLMTFFSA